MAKKKKTPIEKFLAMSDADKDAAVAPFDREFRVKETKPLNVAERKQWRRVKRKIGRPRIGQGSRSVLTTIERGLLKEADAYAKQHGLKRAELIARGLRLAIAQPPTSKAG